MLRKEKREENSRTHVGASPPQLWNKREVGKIKKREKRNLLPPPNSIHAKRERPDQSAAGVLRTPLIFHISLWRDIIPDDCLSVMLYDEKCWGPLMGDVSVYHCDGWPP